MIVLDASVTLSFLLPDENTPAADVIFDAVSRSSAKVPAIWWYEVRNALLVAERRKRLKRGQSLHLLSQLAALPIAIEAQPEAEGAFELAQDRDLSVYDAAYLDLAVRLNSRLATFDESLAEVARKMKILWR